ncbi:MAG: pflA [Haloplasmataceae bacterium]|jgi:pyruvate formate lyase activating enzyme|nr:pflA [Haloplasmataceae bacterium]
MIKAKVHSVETFGTVDGPGIRYVLFLRGCPLRCKYCHNPDTWTFDSNDLRSVDEIVSDVKKYFLFIKKGGGVTVSGGEPLMQIDFLIEFFKELKKYDIHTCIDTTGIIYNDEGINDKIEELMKYTDLVLLDIKHIDNEKHKRLTGLPNKSVLSFAKYLSDKQIPVWIRHVLVPGITTDEYDLLKLKQFLNTLKNVEKVEVIPYHTMGTYKYDKLGIEYSLKDVKPPTKEQIQLAKNILTI